MFHSHYIFSNKIIELKKKIHRVLISPLHVAFPLAIIVSFRGIFVLFF